MFPRVEGVTTGVVHLLTGDYTAEHGNGRMDRTLFERKGIGDLFHSFTHNYEQEKAKIQRAKEAGNRYILAIEGTFLEIRKGHSYSKGGKIHEVKKSGLSQVRQIMTLHKRGDFDEVWWCVSRREMAWRILEYFLAQERIDAK